MAGARALREDDACIGHTMRGALLFENDMCQHNF